MFKFNGGIFDPVLIWIYDQDPYFRNDVDQHMLENMERIEEPELLCQQDPPRREESAS